MNIDAFRKAYAENGAVQAICDHMGAREKNQRETLLHRIQLHLDGDGHEFKKAEVIGAFRALQAAECGKYIEGRKGWKSRFAWEVNSLSLAAVAKGAPAAAAEEDEADEVADMLEHTYNLREDLAVTIELPADLTMRESQRLAEFIGSLSFED